jgi:glycerone phosphate O-acyltransferase/fatty acyl-CoA reductase
VKEVIANMVRERAKQYEGKLQVMPAEDKISADIQKEATQVIDRIASTYSHKLLVYFAQAMKKTFVSIYEKIVVNEQILANLRRLCDDRNGPLIFCPTHRSYIDFLLISLVLYYYKMEVPHICAGEDFLNIIFVNQLLRSSGAFFMRRTFKGDDLYKAIFKEYVTLLATDNLNMEFFIEGTRSRTNKILYPKYGFISILTSAFFKEKVKELTFIPVTINYTRTLEGETFPFELTGEEKVKESLGRLIKAIQIFSMNLGTIYLDFCEPIKLSEFTQN